MQVHTTVNGAARHDEIEDRLLLVHYVRDVCGLTATNVGCDTTSCGACTVLLDGESVKSCTVLAVQAQDADITTVEGLARGEELDGVLGGVGAGVGEGGGDHGVTPSAAASTARTML